MIQVLCEGVIFVYIFEKFYKIIGDVLYRAAVIITKSL